MNQLLLALNFCMMASCRAWTTTIPHRWRVSSAGGSWSHTNRRNPSSTKSPSSSTSSQLNLQEESVDILTIISPSDFPLMVPVVVVAAAGLLVTAQGLINQQLDGDQGLGAYLKDGRGYSGSGFRPLGSSDDEERAVSSDPLPWLKLPQLDFVQVAGQDSTRTTTDGGDYEQVVQELDQLRVQMNELLAEGKVEEATIVRRDLETLLRKNNMTYESD